MPTRKIQDLRNDPAEPCRHPDHEIPTHQYFMPGKYEHTCEGCGRKTGFTVSPPTW